MVTCEIVTNWPMVSCMYCTFNSSNMPLGLWLVVTIFMGQAARIWQNHTTQNGCFSNWGTPKFTHWSSKPDWGWFGDPLFQETPKWSILTPQLANYCWILLLVMPFLITDSSYGSSPFQMTVGATTREAQHTEMPPRHGNLWSHIPMVSSSTNLPLVIMAIGYWSLRFSLTCIPKVDAEKRSPTGWRVSCSLSSYHFCVRINQMRLSNILNMGIWSTISRRPCCHGVDWPWRVAARAVAQRRGSSLAFANSSMRSRTGRTPLPRGDG